MKAGAKFSDDRQYRYALWRIWDESKPLIMFIGLNPSTAAEGTESDDNTIKKVTKVAANNGYGGFYMMNLFAVISTDPDLLLTHPDPLGGNNDALLFYRESCSNVCFCWGAFKQAKVRAEQVKRMFSNALCFKKTKSGAPWHPLYCLDKTVLIEY
jgi:hypothetical protein